MDARLGYFALWLAVFAGAGLAGCNAALKSERVTSIPSVGTNPGSAQKTEKLSGVPWVEARLYEVFIYRGKGDGLELKLLYFGRHALLDRVNGVALQDHEIWVTNYSGGPLSDSSLKLDFHGTSGSLKRAEITGTAKPVEAIGAAGAVLGIEEEREKREIESLKRRKELRDLRRNSE